MVTTYYAQVEINGIDYAHPEHGIVATGIVKIDAVGFISSFEAHPKTKHVKLAKPLNNDEFGLPKEVNLKPKIKEAVLGMIGRVNLPYVKQVLLR